METVAEFDLSTFEGWVAKAISLLKDKPLWTGLADPAGLGFLVLSDGYLCGCPREDQDDYRYSIDDLIPLDSTAWDKDYETWNGDTKENGLLLLGSPVFVQLLFQKEEA